MRPEILKQLEMDTETVEAYGQTLTVSELSAVDRLSLVAEIHALEDGPGLDLRAMAMLVIRAVDEFEPADIDVLTRKKTDQLRKVYDVAARLSGIGQAEEDAEKN